MHGMECVEVEANAVEGVLEGVQAKILMFNPDKMEVVLLS